jgi:hypothetical protein
MARLNKLLTDKKITEDQFNELIKKVKPIDDGEFTEDSSMENLECIGGACPIK